MRAERLCSLVPGSAASWIAPLSPQYKLRNCARVLMFTRLGMLKKGNLDRWCRYPPSIITKVKNKSNGRDTANSTICVPRSLLVRLIAHHRLCFNVYVEGQIEHVKRNCDLN